MYHETQMQLYVDWINSGLKKPGKTKRGLAKALGLDPSIITRIVQGRRRLKADELYDIADYLETPVPERTAAAKRTPEAIVAEALG